MTTLLPLSPQESVSCGRIIRQAWTHATPPPHEFVAVLCPEEEGGYSVFALNYPGVISQGETEKESTDNIAEAFLAMLEARRKHGEDMEFSHGPTIEIPVDGKRVRVTVDG